MPTLEASISTASVNDTWSIFCTKSMTSPPSEHPKQKKKPRAGVTLNEGDFSSWNGHRPFSEPPPAFLSVTCAPMISSIRARSRTSAMSSSLIRPATR